MICVSLQEQNFDRCKEIVTSSQMVEIRGDMCRLSLEQLRELLQHPSVLFTCRIESSSKEYAFEQLVFAIKNGAKWVDVELEAPDDFIESIALCAKEQGCKLIISYHNFVTTNSTEELEQIYKSCLAKGADIVKIVTTAHSTEDGVKTLSLYNNPNCTGAKEGRLIAFAMEGSGQFTRKLCLDLGSPHTYVSVDEQSATAPSQYTKKQIEELLNTKTYPYIFDTNISLPNSLKIPCSKSVAQRAILAAALSSGVSRLDNYSPCNDIDGALEVIKNLGCEVHIKGSTLIIKGLSADKFKDFSSVHVGESGLLTRLLIPLSGHLNTLSGKPITVTGHGSIMSRQLSETIDAMTNAGLSCTSLSGSGATLPFVIEGEFTNKIIEFSGKESSQIVSGFLMTLPLLKYSSTLKIKNPTSVPYIKLTIKTLYDFGIEVDCVEESPSLLVYSIRGGQKYKPATIYLDSDWSSAAAFIVGGAIKGGIKLKNMNTSSHQADQELINLISRCGVDISYEEAEYEGLVDINLHRTQELKAFEFDATHCPDLFPVLATLALNAKGVSKINGVGRLYQKESNRAESIYSQYTTLGAEISITGDTMTITGTALKSGLVSSHNDHRIAMSLIIASLFIDGQVALDNIKCIDKSFPSFLEKLKIDDNE